LKQKEIFRRDYLSFKNKKSNTLPLGKSAARISRLANQTLTEISSLGKYPIKELISMMKKEPVARACAELKSLRISTAIGDYIHPEKRIQDFIREMLSRSESNLDKVYGQLGSACPLGFSVAEIEFGYYQKYVVLKSLDVLDHRYITFRGYKGNIYDIKYRNINEVSIPYKKAIHVVNGYATDFDDPYGNPEMYAALPYIKAKLSFLSNMVVAGKNLATGILIGKTTDKMVNLYDSNGKPLNPPSKPSVQVLGQAFEKLSDNNYIVTDIENEIFSVSLPDGANFWMPGLQLLDKYIMRSFAIPDLVFSEGTNVLTKSATLAGKHYSLMDSTINAVVTNIRNELVHKVITPIIKANFGEQQKGYGHFSVSKQVDEHTENQYLSNRSR
jgi:hypothetical protein